MTNRPIARKSTIPDFANDAEAAAFWDVHSPSEFSAEFDEVADIKFIRPTERQDITVRLEPDLLAALGQLADELQSSPTVIVRRWIREGSEAHRQSK